MTSVTSSRMRWVLLASLGLNVVLLVAIGVARFGAAGEGRHGDATRIPTPWMLRSSLSDERRADVEPVLRQYRPALRGAVREMRVARRDVEQALRAEPFDADALARALAEVRERDAAAAAAVHAMLVDASARLDADEREQVAERLWRRHRGAEHRMHEGSDRPMRPARAAGRMRDDDAATTRADVLPQARAPGSDTAPAVRVPADGAVRPGDARGPDAGSGDADGGERERAVDTGSDDRAPP